MFRLLPLTAITLLLGCSSEIPQVRFAKTERETVASTVQTNGKIAALGRTLIRAGREGAVKRIVAERGQQVRAGAAVLELDAGPDRESLAAAEARIAQAKADLAVLDQGGPESVRVPIENDLSRARLELGEAERESAATGRLVDRDAATRHELELAKDRVSKARLRVVSLERKLRSLVSSADRAEAISRLRSGEADATAARHRIEEACVRAPVAGVLYRLETRPGDYLRPGDLVGEVGDVDRLRAIVYVDEPELGRVKPGMAVKITWDGLPGAEWDGKVEKIPSEVVARGTRQVGEVRATIENSGRRLPPGANIDAEIQCSLVKDALTVPKEALRRRGGEIGVFVLAADSTVRWRSLEIGTSSITRAEVKRGLSDGEAVVLPSGASLDDGSRVNAVISEP